MTTSRTDACKAAAFRLRVAAVACVALPLLGGCASLARQDSAPVADDVPATWSGTNDPTPPASSSLVQWWLRFDDAPLAKLVDQAMGANTTVNGARAALLQARALRDVAAAGLLPTVGISASAQHGTSGGHSTGNNFRAGLDANWELDVFGGNRSALDAAEAAALGSAATLGDVRVSIAAEVALDYIALRGVQARLAIARDNLASQLETLQITQWRLQAGLTTSLEAEQARSAAELTQSRVPALQTTIEQTGHALAVLTGQPPAALSSVQSTAGPLPQLPADIVLSFPAETLRQRPDVRAAEYQVSAALARVAQADAARMPSFNIGGSLGLTALTLGTLTNGGSVVSAVLASASMPLFDGGAARARVRAEEAALDAARAAYRSAVLTALKDVEDALVALRGDRERLLRLRNAADAAGNAALMARQRYSSGLIDFQIVLETQRTRFATEESVAIALADLGADYVRLYKALGGGWSADAGDAVPIPTESRNPPS